MQIYKQLGSYPIHGKEVLQDSIVARFQNGTIVVCHDFRMRNGKLSVHVWDIHDKAWKRAEISDSVAGSIMAFYRQSLPKNPSRIPYGKMMHHNHKHKGGGCGQRLIPKADYRAITDYECTKNPLHDFRRVCYY